MAAATSTVSAWSKPGAWALDSEENEAELLKEPANPAAFPSLAAAAATKQHKKKKPTTISLAEFAAPKFPIGRNYEDPIVLPTGPRERTAEELDRTRLGGGFKSYGGGGGEDNSSRWGSSRVSDDSRRNRDSGRDRDAPSRADEIDNWASTKKPIGGGGSGFDKRERGGGGFFSDSQSKADGVDSWVSNKTFTPSSEGRRFGGGFEKRSSFDSLSNGGNGIDSDNWGRKKSNTEEINTNGGGTGRPKLVLQPRTLPVVESKEEEVVKVSAKGGSNPFGAARPREEVLKEKGVDVNEVEKKFDAAKVAVESKEEEVVKVSSKVGGSNPFGAARPREEVLKEKGVDVNEVEKKFEAAVKVASDKEEKPEAKKGGFGNGWSVDKGESAWRKPPTLQSAEKNENDHADEN